MKSKGAVYLVGFTAIVALAGCSRSPVITIINRSTNSLANVVVSGTGFSVGIDSIAAGSEHKFKVHPSGESGLRVAFDASGQHVDVNDLAYLENDDFYDTTVTVQPDFKVLPDLRAGRHKP